MQYDTVNEDLKRMILQQRLAEAERLHFETEMNLMGCQAAPVRTQVIERDLGALQTDLQNLEALIVFTKEQLKALPVLAADDA